MGFICDNVTSLGAVTLLVGIASGVGSWLNQVGNNYLENKQVSTHNSSGKLRQDLNSLQENITQSFLDVDYGEVAKSALVGMAFAPMAYGTNKIITSAFTGLENNFVNKAGEYIASGFIEFNNSSIQFIVDLF